MKEKTKNILLGILVGVLVAMIGVGVYNYVTENDEDDNTATVIPDDTTGDDLVNTPGTDLV